MIRSTIESTSVEQWPLILQLETDPDTDLPEFGITAPTATDPSGTWVDGSWSVAWDSSTKRAEATTPTLGSGADLDTDGSDMVDLWCRVGTVVVKVARIRVT